MDENESLNRVEELIENNELNEAQSLLDGIEECSGRKYYVQSKLFAKKGWYKEQHRLLDYAINCEPENAEYKDALEKLAEIESREFTDEYYYERTEARLKSNEPDFAQNTLNLVKEDTGRKHFLQSKIYQQKKWYNEQFKELKKAIKSEPDNEEYKKELAELKEFKKSGEFKQYKKENAKRQMGKVGGVCAEGACEGSGYCCVYCCCEGVCEGIGNGC